MGNSLLVYMDKLAPYIYTALNSDPNDDYDVHGIAIETVDVLFTKYKDALLPYCDSIIDILTKSYAVNICFYLFLYIKNRNNKIL